MCVCVFVRGCVFMCIGNCGSRGREVRSLGAGITGSLSVVSAQTQHQVLWESAVLVSFCVKLKEPRVTWGEGTSKEGLPQVD